MRLKDKVIIVTGSTTGIGEAIARRCVAEGARVLLHGLEPDLGEAVAADLGMPLEIADLADPAVPARLVARALAELRRAGRTRQQRGLGLSRPDRGRHARDFR